MNAGYVLKVQVRATKYISIRCATALYGFRPYGGSLLSNSHKSKQKGLALPYGRLAKARRCPHSGTVMGARRDGPSMAHRGWRGVLPRHPHNSTCVRPSVRGIHVAWLIEWPQQKQKQRQRQRQRQRQNLVVASRLDVEVLLLPPKRPTKKATRRSPYCSFTQTLQIRNRDRRCPGSGR